MPANARFAPVVPISVADAYLKAGMLGDYHLLLAHDVIQHPGEYHRIYANQNNWIIMDNSVIELGHPLSLVEMQAAVGVTQSSVFVLPDELLDCDATLAKSISALDTWSDLITDYTRAMAVPQGSTWEEWIECVEGFAPYREIDWIGVPRNVKERLGVSRVEACKIVNMLCPNKKIHLLGFSDSLVDDVNAARLGQAHKVMGIDSAVPTRMGMRDNIAISLARSDHSSRGDWWDNPGEVNDLAITNVTTFRSWIQ